MKIKAPFLLDTTEIHGVQVVTVYAHQNGEYEKQDAFILPLQESDCPTEKQD